jgi:hypothetical protein
VFQGESPSYTDPVDEIRAFWVEDGDQYLTGDYIIGVGLLIFFFPFISALRGLLGIAEGGAQMWSRIVFAGAVLFLAIAGAAGAAWTTLAFGDFAENASDDTIELLMALDVGAWHFVPVGLVLMALPTGLVVLQTKVLPVWYGALSLIYGVLALISMLSIMADDPEDSALGFIAFLGGAIWVLLTSIVMIMKDEAPVPAVQREM